MPEQQVHVFCRHVIPGAKHMGAAEYTFALINKPIRKDIAPPYSLVLVFAAAARATERLCFTTAESG